MLVPSRSGYHCRPLTRTRTKDQRVLPAQNRIPAHMPEAHARPGFDLAQLFREQIGRPVGVGQRRKPTDEAEYVSVQR